MKKLALYSTAIIFLSHATYAGAWTQDAGRKQIIVTGSVYSADHYFDNRGHRRSQPNYYKQELNFYGEYGWRDGITFGAQSAVARVFKDGMATNNSRLNLDDSEVFVRKRVWKNANSILSLQPFVVIPSPDRFSSRPKVGSDHYSTGLALNYGHGFQAFNRHHFVDFSADYTYRFAEPKDQLHASATVGFQVTQNISFMPQLFLTQRVQSPSNPSFTESSADDYNQLSGQLSALYSFSPQTRIQLGYYNHFHGKNTGAGSGLQLGWWRSF